MKFEPLNATDYADTIIYKRFMPAGTAIDRILKNGNLPKRRRYADILNEFGGHLFKSFDCFNITEQQLNELNRLVKLGIQIIDTYIPKTEQQNINLGTFPAYLFKATREFYMTHVSKDFLAKARGYEDSNHYGRELKCGTRVFLHSDICPDYMPRQVKSKMRNAFKKEYGVYPENIYIAVVFYLMPYVLGIKSADPICDNGLLRMVLNNINPTLHNKQCGTAPKKSYKQYADNIFTSFEQDMLSGKHRELSAIAIKFSIQASHKLRDSIVSRFNKKYNLKRITDFYKPKN